MIPPKAAAEDTLGRFREIVSDPLNLLIYRHPLAGTIADGLVMLHNGNRVPLCGGGAYYGEFSNILVINRGVHEPLEEYIFQEVLKRLSKRPLMVELGAYWAHYSMWLKRVWAEADTFMVDCDAGNLAVGEENFLRNGFSGRFSQAGHGVNTFAVDSLGAEHIDILHVDAEGDEIHALDGARQALQAGRIDYLFISTHGEDRHRQTLRVLTENPNYRVEVTADWHETTSFDGLVFASRTSLPAVFSKFQAWGRQMITGATPGQLMLYLDDLAMYHGRP